METELINHAVNIFAQYENLDLISQCTIVVTTIITLGSIIVRLTPSKKDDEIMGRILKIIETISLNKKGK